MNSKAFTVIISAFLPDFSLVLLLQLAWPFLLAVAHKDSFLFLSKLQVSQSECNNTDRAPNGKVLSCIMA
jgi:hypothetical protein